MVKNLGTANDARIPKTTRTMMISMRVKPFYLLEYLSPVSSSGFPASNLFHVPAFSGKVIEVKGMQINKKNGHMTRLLY